MTIGDDVFGLRDYLHERHGILNPFELKYVE